MKLQKIVLVLVLAAVLISPISVSAATSAGVKPGSFWYVFDTAFEKISLFFTFNPEKKAEKALGYANERLVEVEAVANENKPELVATAMSNYQKNVSLAIAKSKEVENKEKVEYLLSTIADNVSRHQEVLTKVYNQVPDKAKEAVDEAIKISINGQNEALKATQELKKTVREVQKDIESLKQKEQLEQSKAIEDLQKEIENLKSQQSSKKVVEKNVESLLPISQKSTTKFSNSEIIEKIKPAVVYIQTNDSSGSGMVIENDGYILTNAHVIRGVSTARIKLSDGRLFIGSVVGRDEDIDLALLKIKEDNLPTVILGDSSTNALKQGDEVFAFGYPFGLEGDVSFKEGTISRRIESYLETSAEIHPGNSGGPLVNRYGQVIGINTAIFGKSIEGIQLGETIKLAIPINSVKNLISDLKAGRNIIVESKEEKEAKKQAENQKQCLVESEQYYNKLVSGIEQIYSPNDPQLQSLISQIDQKIESIKQDLNDQVADITSNANRTISELQRIAESEIKSYEMVAARNGISTTDGVIASQIVSVREKLDRDIAYYESQKKGQIAQMQLIYYPQIEKYVELKTKAYSDREKGKQAALEGAKTQKAEYYRECISE